jgi:CorA-like Mg2+ transporter protein
MVTASWEQKSRFFVRSGLLDHGTVRAHAALDRLAQKDQLSVHSQNLAYVLLPLATYLASATIIGSRYDHIPFEEFTLEGEKPTMLLIRGFPRLSLLQLLGDTLRLEPGALLEHLGFPGSFRIMSPPSMALPCITLRMISLGTYGTSKHFDQSSYALQHFADQETKQYNSEVLEHDQFGADYCRKVNVHGPHFFSVEQEVTFLVYSKQESSSWSGIIMNDSGQATQKVPWRRHSAKEGTPLFFPMTRHGHCALETIVLPSPYLDRRDIRDFGTPDPCFSRAQNDTKLLLLEHRALGLKDPFVLVCDLLDTFVLTWTRLFSFLKAFHESLGGDAEERVWCLRNDKSLIDRGHRHIQAMLNFIDSRGNLKWPSCQDEGDRKRIQALTNSVRGDLEFLLKEAQSLSTAAAQSISVEMSTISVSESKKALAQARKLEWLTLLAFVFIPCQFIASCFGMNITVLDDPKPPLWTFFAFSLPLTLLCLLLPGWRAVKSFVR